MVECTYHSPFPKDYGLTGCYSNYVNRETAERFNLTFGGGETFILRSDHNTPLDPAGPGRSSVRLKSVMQYVNHVAV